MKIKLRIILCSLAAGFLFNSNAQTQGIIPNRGCGTGQLPQQFENWVQTLSPVTSGHGGGQNQTMSVYNIPVIVHVIHSNEALNSTIATTGGNLNALQIIDQINILNKDYNAMNTDTTLIPTVFRPVMGRMQFNFCLAVVNPTGGILAEPGIDRVNATAAGWSGSAPYSTNYVDATIKPATIWDPTRYMNMWVLSLGSGLLGYATFPNPGTSGLQGLTGSYGTTTTDGLVMLNSAFGSIGTAVGGAPYNLGRTATHEIGHWVGLRHVWGDNGQCGATDYCNDTPPQEGGTASPAGANYGCPTFPLHANTCTLSGVSNVHGDMFMNYMDYTNDACMYMFTNDQKNRAQLIMTNSTMRATLLTSTVCSLPTTTNDVGISYIANPTYSQVINCVSYVSPILHIQNYGSNIVSSVNFSFNVDGVNTQTIAWTGTLVPSSYIIVGLPQIGNLSNGPHILNVGAYSPNGGTDPNMINNVNSQVFSMANNFTVGVIGNTLICPAQSASLTESAVAATSFTWLPGGTNATTMVVSPTVTTTYTLLANNGTCTNSQTVQVVVGAGVSVVASTPTLCGGGSAVLTASGAASYTWNAGSNSPSITVSPSVTTTYSLNGYNGSCTGSAAITITVGTAPALTVSANPATPICNGGSATLSASGASTYSWSPGNTGASVVVSPASNTVYTVTGANSGCVGTQTIAVSVGAGSITLLISASPSTVCAGGSVTLTANGATTYSWNTGANTPTVVVNPTTTTAYSFDGSDGTCLGHASTTLNITPAPPLLISVSPSSGTVCLGNTATLSASGGYTNYAWSLPSANNPSITVTPGSTVATSYTLNSFDAVSGCAVSSMVTVYVNTSPVSVLSNTNSSCSSPCTGAVSATTTGGTAPYTYNMNGSSCTSGSCANLCPGLYTMHTNDAIGCQSFNIFSISNFAVNFVASVSSTNASSGINSDGTAHANLFSGIPPYTYTWAPSGGNQATATNLAWGCYTVMVTDSVGCIVSANGCVYIVDGISTIPGDNTSLQVYPNPAKEQVSIACDGDQFSYTIYNHLGQLLLSQKNNKGTAVINTAHFASGIYLVEVDNGKDRLRKKLVIE